MQKKSLPIPHIALVLLLGSLTAFDPLTIDMYLPAFNSIQKDFQTSMGMVELSITTFFIGMATGQLIYGPLADRFGRKPPLFVGMFLYMIATMACAVAPNIESFIAFRFFQAIGGCAGMVITRAIIRDLYEPREVASFLSNMALIMGIAPIAAPSIGAFILTFAPWQTIFWTLAGANFVCMLILATFLPETNHHRKTSIHFKGTLQSYWHLLRQRKFLGYLIPDATLRAGMFAYIAGSPFVFIELLHIPVERYGLVFGANGLGLMMASQLNRQLLKRFSPQKILNASTFVAVIASVIVFIIGLTIQERFVFLISIFVFLASLNFVSPNSLALVLADQGHQAGLASALYGCLQWSMGSLSSFLVGHFHNGTALPMTSVIMLCGLTSFVSYQILIKDRFHSSSTIKADI